MFKEQIRLENIIKNQSYTNKKMKKKIDNYRKLVKFKDRKLEKILNLKKCEGNCISKEKLKAFFSSRLEKYCEADDGMYQQDYLTRGELELVDRYKECRELAKIILEEDIEPEVPQDCLKKDIIREDIKKIDEFIEINSNENGYIGDVSIEYLNMRRKILTKIIGE